MKNQKSCYHCGGQHKAEVYRFRTEKCQKCAKIRHIAKKYHSRVAMHQVEEPVTKSNKTGYTVAALGIMVGNRTFSDQKWALSNHLTNWSDKMSDLFF